MQLAFSNKIIVPLSKPNFAAGLKQHFLKSMKLAKGYKRYLGSPLRYAGRKSLATNQIIECFPDRLTKKVVSFCFGGGSIIALNRELQKEIIGYDLFDILVNYWPAQIRYPQQIKKFKPIKQVYTRIESKLKKHWLKEIKLSKLDLASHYFFNHNLNYGSGFIGWMSKIYEDEGQYRRTIEKARDFKCKNLTVHRGSFEKTIPEHREDFLYLNHPYFLEGNSKMFRGIYPQRNFPVHHKGFDRKLLKDLLLKHRGKFVLSYNDCSQVRKLYKGFDI